jgi:hypothetical protein
VSTPSRLLGWRQWFVIGNSPWANPGQRLGMFAYWATVLALRS